MKTRFSETCEAANFFSAFFSPANLLHAKSLPRPSEPLFMQKVGYSLTNLLHERFRLGTKAFQVIDRMVASLHFGAEL